MTYFPAVESLPTADDIEAAGHANDWIYNPKTGSAAAADNKPRKHQQNQGCLAGASHQLPTKETKHG